MPKLAGAASRLACLPALLAVSAGAASDSLSLLQASVGSHSVTTFSGQEFRFTRKVAAIEPGSSLHFKVGHGCKVADQHGANDCSLQWGSVNDALVKLHLARGVQPGDRLSMEFSTDAMAHNDHEAGLSQLYDGEAMHAKGGCQLCEGSCSLVFTKGTIQMDAIVPSVIDDQEACAQLGRGEDADMVLFNSTVLPMGPLGKEFNVPYLELVGNIKMRVILERRDGSPRLDASFNFKVGEGSARPLSALQLERGQLLERRQERHRATTLVGALGAAASETVSRMAWNMAGNGKKEKKEKKEKKVGPQKDRGHTAVAAKESSEKQDTGTASFRHMTGRLDSVRAKFQVFYFENGAANHNVSVTEGKYCKAMDAKGSFDCQLPFTSPLMFGVKLHLGAEFEQGSTFDLKVEPKFGGLLGKSLTKLAPPVRLTLPLCGEPQNITILGKSVEFVPPRCGRYAMNLEAPHLRGLMPGILDEPLALPKELANIPFLPRTLAQMPACTVMATLTLKHKDQQPILSVKGEIGLEAKA